MIKELRYLQHINITALVLDLPIAPTYHAVVHLKEQTQGTGAVHFFSKIL